MDLRAYFKSIRDQQAAIATEYVVVVSKATSDGGREGVLSELSRETAATLVVEGRARLATEDETATYGREMGERRQKANEAAIAQRLQVAVISDTDMQSFKSNKRNVKP